MKIKAAHAVLVCKHVIDKLSTIEGLDRSLGPHLQSDGGGHDTGTRW